MAIFRLGDLEMYYEIHGDGAPLMLVAGYTCDHAFWSSMVAALSKRFRVVVFDNRAVGRTNDGGKPFSIETMAMDTVALIDHLALHKPVVVGQSMGGAIVQTMLSRSADACGPCVILNSTSRFNTVACMALDGLLALRQADIEPGLLIDASLPWLFGAEWLSSLGNIEAFKAAVASNPVPQSVADQARQMVALRGFDARASNKRWRYPSLVVSASDDLLAPVHEGRLLADQLDAHFVEIPGGHASPVEQPEYLSKLLMDFLAE